MRITHASTAKKIALGLACAVCLALTLLWASELDGSIVARGDNDFAGLYTGARLATSPDLYSADSFVRAQAAFAHVKQQTVLFARPPFYALFLRPLASLPYREAYVVFEIVNAAAFGFFLYLFARRDMAMWLIGGASIPVLTVFALGQDVMLVLLICAGVILQMRRGNRFQAGALLSLYLIKPHLFLLFPVMLIARREWRVIGGLLAGGVGLFFVSVLAQGWAWPAAYLKLLTTTQDLVPYTMPNLRGLVAAIVGPSLSAELVLAAVVVLWVAYVTSRHTGESDGESFEGAFALSAAAGLLTSHHAYIQDCCLLLLVPALLRSRPDLRTLALVLLAPPVYFLLLAGPLSVLLPLGIGALLATYALGSPDRENAESRVIAADGIP